MNIALFYTTRYFFNVFDYERMYAISQQHVAAPHTTSTIAFWLLRILSIYRVLIFFI